MFCSVGKSVVEISILHNINYSTNTRGKYWFPITYLIFASIVSIKSVNSQNQTDLKSITYDFEISQKKKIDSTINFYSIKQKKSWLNLLPSFNYDLDSHTFNVGVSLNSLASFYQQKKRNKIELAKLEMLSSWFFS